MSIPRRRGRRRRSSLCSSNSSSRRAGFPGLSPSRFQRPTLIRITGTRSDDRGRQGHFSARLFNFEESWRAPSEIEKAAAASHPSGATSSLHEIRFFIRPRFKGGSQRHRDRESHGNHERIRGKKTAVGYSPDRRFTKVKKSGRTRSTLAADPSDARQIDLPDNAVLSNVPVNPFN